MFTFKREITASQLYGHRKIILGNNNNYLIFSFPSPPP